MSVNPYEFPEGIAIHVRKLLSGVIDESESMLPVFMEAYFEWLESEHNAGALIYDLPHLQNVDYKPDEYFEYFHQQFMSLFPYELATDKQNLLKHVGDLYRSKGTEPAVRLLFRILYNEEIDVTYPGDYLLRPSDGDWDNQNKVFLSHSGFLDDDYVLQDGQKYQQYSYVIHSNQDYEDYKEVLKKLAHPAGVRVAGENRS